MTTTAAPSTRIIHIFTATGNPTESHSSERAIKIVLSAILIALGTIGNGSIGYLVLRFKDLRTVPNILLGNLALVDFLSSIVSLPLVLSAVVIEKAATQGRLMSTVVFVIQSAFILLRMLCLLVLVGDRYLATTRGTRYKLWKSNMKVLAASGVLWVLVLFLAIPLAFYLYQTNLGDSSYTVYHAEYSKLFGKYNCFFTYPAISVATLLLTALIFRHQIKIYATQDDVGACHDSSGNPQALARKKETRATITITVTVILYELCLLPYLVHCGLISSSQNVQRNASGEWFLFFSFVALYLAGACSPYIYALRSNRLRKALGRLWTRRVTWRKKLEHGAQINPQQARQDNTVEKYREEAV